MFRNSDGETEIFAFSAGSKNAGATYAEKFFIQNDLSRETGIITASFVVANNVSDLKPMMRWAICPDTISCPYNVVATVQAGGNLAADTTYYFRITGYNNVGETTGSIEVSALTTSVNKSIVLTWDLLTPLLDGLASSDMAGYVIYRSTNQDYTNASRVIIEDPNIVTWTDRGQVFGDSYDDSYLGFSGFDSGFSGFSGMGAAMSLPDENTTAGEAPDYGTAPALSADDLVIGVLEPGQQVAIWLGVVSSAGTTEEGNPRAVILNFTEAT